MPCEIPMQIYIGIIFIFCEIPIAATASLLNADVIEGRIAETERVGGKESKNKGIIPMLIEGGNPHVENTSHDSFIKTEFARVDTYIGFASLYKHKDKKVQTCGAV